MKDVAELASLSAALLLRPKIDAVHVTVSKPKRAMMNVITLFQFRRLAHRIAARHLRTGGAEDRPENRFRTRLHQIARKQLAVQFDLYPTSSLLELESLGGRRGCKQAEGKDDGENWAQHWGLPTVRFPDANLKGPC